jgi:hypothetical protein
MEFYPRTRSQPLVGLGNLAQVDDYAATRNLHDLVRLATLHDAD